MYTYKATIIDVYDGDTATAVVDLGMRISTIIRIRFNGINTPEVRGDGKEAGMIARDRVRNLILGKEVVIKTYKDKQEKYGRWLADVYLPNEETSINQLLVSEGLAVAYIG